LREQREHALLWRQLTTIALDAPLALPAPVFTRLPADADMLAGLCESLRFGPMTRRRLLTAAGVAPPFPVTTDFRP
ncbi:exodeoxyribonuclease IX, partial [Xanthomonas sp. Kuri4-1]